MSFCFNSDLLSTHVVDCLLKDRICFSSNMVDFKNYRVCFSTYNTFISKVVQNPSPTLQITSPNYFPSSFRMSFLPTFSGFSEYLWVSSIVSQNTFPLSNLISPILIIIFEICQLFTSIFVRHLNHQVNTRMLHYL